MIVVNMLANGNCEIFQTQNFVLGTKEDLHPLILKCVVFTDSGKKMQSLSRKHKWYYKHFVFPTAEVQNKLKKLQEQNNLKNEQNP